MSPTSQQQTLPPAPVNTTGPGTFQGGPLPACPDGSARVGEAYDNPGQCTPVAPPAPITSVPQTIPTPAPIASVPLALPPAPPTITTALQRLKNCCKKQQQTQVPGASMSPMDEMTWFNTPQESLIALPAQPAYGLVIPADPMRVGLIFGGGGTSSTFWLSTLSTNATARGMVVVPNEPNIYLTQAQWGPLVQGAWYGSGALGGASVTVIALTLQAWPASGPSPSPSPAIPVGETDGTETITTAPTNDAGGTTELRVPTVPPIYETTPI